MLIGIKAQDLRHAVTNNTEPFVNEGALGTNDHEPESVGFDSDYLVETEYGRLWSKSFAERHSSLLAGPCQPAMRCFANDDFLSVPFRLVPRSRVTSRDALLSTLREIRDTAQRVYGDRVILFRGQTREYLLEREPVERKYLFGRPNALEPSLQPSSARRGGLDNVATAVWGVLVQRHLANSGAYAGAHRIQDVGRVWPHGTSAGLLINLAFAQHYGLPTPALDVTRDVGVALWFALHSIKGSGANASVVEPAYGGDGVIYVIAADRNMYFDDQLTGENAVRPHRQQGGFLASNWGNSKNRAARYLAAAVYFPHSLLLEVVATLPTAEHLFPGPSEDPFVSFLQDVAWRKRRGSAALQQIADHVYWIEPRTVRGALDQGELERRARDHDVVAALQLGLICRDAGDRKAAEQWWRVAAEQSPSDATAAGWALWSSGDPDGEVISRFAVDAGDIEAMNNLGLMSQDCNDLAEAERYFLQAAEAGVVFAAYHLGTLLIKTGRATEGERWLLRAAEAGDIDAAANLGASYVRRGAAAEAEPWLRTAAEAGEANAAFNLASCRERAGDTNGALKWYRNAAELGDPDAPFHAKRLADQTDTDA
jgi:TPR repeat protein